MKKKSLWIGLVSFLFLIGSLGIRVVGEDSFQHMTKEEIAERIEEETQLILDSNLSDLEKAEQFSHLGELTLIPQGFTFSLDLFERALSFNADHPRANFYSAVLKPAMTLEKVPGKFLNSDLLPESYRNELSRKLDEIPAEYRTFFFDPNAPTWSKLSEVQAFLKESFIPALEVAAERVEKLSANTNLEFYFDHTAWSGDNALPYKIDHSIIETTAASLRGLIGASKIVISYDVDDLFLFDQWLAEEHSLGIFKLSNWEELPAQWPFLVRHLQTNFPQLGTLKEKEILQGALEDAQELVILIRSAYPALCNRFDRKIPADFSDTMDKIAAILAGPELLVLGHDAETNEELSILINAPVLFQEPIADLKSLLPFVPSAELTDAQKEELRALVAQLGNEAWEDREAARKTIAERYLGDLTALSAAPFLREEGERHTDLEIQMQIENLLREHAERVAEIGYPLTFIDLTFGGLFPNGDLFSTLMRLQKADQDRLKKRFPRGGW